MKMKSYLRVQGVSNFVNDSFSCPSPHLVVANEISLQVNHSFLYWKQQD